MPKYSSHLIFNFIIISILFIIYQLAGAPLTILQLSLFLVFYALGSIILTPDLDSKSEASRMCGTVCTPYRKIFKHRGTSHSVILGVISRILYVAMLVVIIIGLVWVFIWKFQINGGLVFTFFVQHIREIAIAGGGLFLSNLLHIILDKII